MGSGRHVALVLGLVLALTPQATTQNRSTLDIYYVDVEGGAATLFVAPSGESLLVDSGHPGTIDAERIAAAAKLAGLKQLDYLVTSHHHLDHVGGAPELNARLPIRTFVDHGLPTAQELKDNERLYQAYLAVRAGGRHLPVKPGDTIPIKQLDVQVVSSGGEHLAKPLAGAGAPNPLCGDFTPKPETPLMGGENGRSVGIVVRYGSFRTIVLGDLTWNREHELVCPNNLLGTVDVYLTTHHGLDISGPRAIVHALRPRVAVMNNGPTKGGTPTAWRIVRDSPGLEDFWQGHYSVKAGREHNAPEPFIANLDETGSACAAHWIKVSAQSDGSFVVTNGRNQFSKTYKPRS
jgi:beta-lactamase superfamily II metal-dependent hydrolase